MLLASSSRFFSSLAIVVVLIEIRQPFLVTVALPHPRSILGLYSTMGSSGSSMNYGLQKRIAVTCDDTGRASIQARNGTGGPIAAGGWTFKCSPAAHMNDARVRIVDLNGSLGHDQQVYR